MAPKLLGRIGGIAQWLAPLLIGAGFVALWWFKQQDPPTAAVLARVVGISVMAYAGFISYRAQRRLDEVQIASQGFASRHGWSKGALVAVLLLMFPPFTNWVVDLVNMLSTVSPTLSDRRAVQLAFTFGACFLMVMQLLGYIVSTAIWRRRMGGMGERS